MSMMDASPALRTKTDDILAPNPLARQPGGPFIHGQVPGGGTPTPTPTPVTPGSGVLNPNGSPNFQQKDAPNPLAPNPLGAPTPVTPTPVTTPTTGPSGNPYGTSGVDLMNSITQSIQSRQWNPALGAFGTWQDMSPGGDQSNYAFHSNNPRVNDDGTIKGPNGEQMFQVGGDSGHYVKDPSRVIHDPEFGDLTTQDNLTDNGGNFFDRYGGWLLMAPALAATGAAAIGDLAGTGAATAGDASGLFAGGNLTATGGTDLFAGGSASAAAGFNPATAADALSPNINQLINPVTSPTLPALDAAPTFTTPTPGNAADLFTGGSAGATGSFDPATAASNLLTPGNALRAGATAATLLGNHRPTATGPGNTALQNNITANQPLANDARDVLTNHGAPTNDQRGAIDASIEQQWAQGQEAIMQASINSGQGGKDSMVTQDKLRAFRGQLETMRQQLYMKQAEQNTLTALRELGMVTEQQFLLAQMELQQNTQAQQRAASIMQSLGWLWTLGG